KGFANAVREPPHGERVFAVERCSTEAFEDLGQLIFDDFLIIATVSFLGVLDDLIDRNFGNRQEVVPMVADLDLRFVVFPMDGAERFHYTLRGAACGSVAAL